MATNRYKATCHTCGGMVPARGGRLIQHEGWWQVDHLACLETGQPEVIEIYSPVTGSYSYINRRGRCEDAPCCGCCTN